MNLSCNWYTSNQKIVKDVLNEFSTGHISYTSKYFEIALIEVCSSHLHASFSTFCDQIDQLFEAQWVFEECLIIDKVPFSKESVADFEFLWMLKDSKIDQFEHKCWKIRSVKMCIGLSKIRSVNTYVIP